MHVASTMSDTFPTKNSNNDWHKKYLSSQSELHDKEKMWQDVELLCRILIDLLTQRLDFEGVELINKLEMLSQSLRDGEGIISLQELIKDVAGKIHALEQKTSASDFDLNKNKTCTNEQVKLIGDVLYVLLDSINFLSQFSSDVNNIKLIISKEDHSAYYHNLLSGITSLAELLTEIFDTVQHDKRQIEYYLKHISSELQHLDEGLTTSGILHHETQLAEDNMTAKVESEVQEMENTMVSLIDVEELKTTVQKSMNMIRGHMDSLRQRFCVH